MCCVCVRVGGDSIVACCVAAFVICARCGSIVWQQMWPESGMCCVCVFHNMWLRVVWITLNNQVCIAHRICLYHVVHVCIVVVGGAWCGSSYVRPHGGYPLSCTHNTWQTCNLMFAIYLYVNAHSVLCNSCELPHYEYIKCGHLQYEMHACLFDI